MTVKSDPSLAADGPLMDTLKQAEHNLNIGHTKIYEEIGAGRLQVVKVGRKTMVTKRAQRAYVELLEREAEERRARQMAEQVQKRDQRPAGGARRRGDGSSRRPAA